MVAALPPSTWPPARPVAPKQPRLTPKQKPHQPVWLFYFSLPLCIHRHMNQCLCSAKPLCLISLYLPITEHGVNSYLLPEVTVTSMFRTMPIDFCCLKYCLLAYNSCIDDGLQWAGVGFKIHLIWNPLVQCILANQGIRLYRDLNPPFAEMRRFDIKQTCLRSCLTDDQLRLHLHRCTYR